ncbi:MAG: RbtT/DalT/CsbX family MFS transporter [Janthinobacterium lividum]
MSAHPSARAAPEPTARVGTAIPRDFALQYVGLLIFMIGDGVEVGYLSPYLVSLGFDTHFVALLFTVYGLSAAAAAALSGVLCDTFGSRKVILAGLVAWVVPHILFLTLAIPQKSPALLLATYGIRGLGYPLMAYGLLTMLMREIRTDRRGLGAGIFWFCFAAGLPTLGTVVAQVCLPRLGDYRTLWIGFAAVLLGGALALLPVRRALGGARRDGAVPAGERPSIRQIGKVARENPALVLTAITRAINSSATHGIIVFMPLYFTREAGMTQSQWLSFLEIIFLSNIVFNVVFGALGDATSWVKTIVWVGGVGGAIASVLMYWGPLLYGRADPLFVYAIGAFFGMTLAGYVPLSAVAPSLLPGNTGIAMSFLNLGAGTSVWLGPAVVYLVEPHFGAQGVLYTYAAMFLASAFIAARLSPDQHGLRQAGQAARANSLAEKQEAAVSPGVSQ